MPLSKLDFVISKTADEQLQHFRTHGNLTNYSLDMDFLVTPFHGELDLFW
jgi:hypothetical protein